MTREEELAGQGWKKCATYDDPRLSEMVETYKEIGYEVLLEPAVSGDTSGCTECLRASPARHMTIYIRRTG